MVSATRLTAAILITVHLTGCAAMPDEGKSPEAGFTQDMAMSTFEKVVTGVAKDGVSDFCSKYARSTGTCALLLKDALDWCLLPGDKPQIEHAAYISPNGRSEGGWLLEVRGKTMDGQQYVSEFLVVRRDKNPPQAAFGIYWTGLDVEGSPFGPNNTKIPQNACSDRSGTSSG